MYEGLAWKQTSSSYFGILRSNFNFEFNSMKSWTEYWQTLFINNKSNVYNFTLYLSESNIYNYYHVKYCHCTRVNESLDELILLHTPYYMYQHAWLHVSIINIYRYLIWNYHKHKTLKNPVLFTCCCSKLIL